ncbi:PAS domain-containing protein [Granulicella sp. S190]|uniref:PAS domain-containing protein n=1 Tax=Granulicella sp. S190 TaxID=1747226 RepID=UPI00131E0BF1|nr:PAS domain-containing protein [Granulicella sp. S190]
MKLRPTFVPMSDPTIKAPVALNRRAQFRRESDAENDNLSHLVALLPEAILCFDRNWVCTYANSEAVKVSRIQPSDIHAKTHWQLFPETVGTAVERAYRSVMLNRVPQHIEHFYAPFNVWVDVQILPTEEGVALYYRDVTERKHAESLRDSAVRQLQQIFDASPDSIVCIDRNWICTFANLAALDILKTDTLVGANLWERFPSNQKEPFVSHYRATMERRIATEFEAYYPEPLDIWFRVSARPYEDGIIIFSSDITDRKGAELLRDASTRQLRQVLETTTDAVISIDHDWNLTYLNRRAKEILSPKGDLLGKNLWREFPVAAQSNSEYRYHYHRAMDQGIPGEFEAYYPAPINLWLTIQCRPYDGGMVVFFRDITARRQSDLILKRQHDLLASVQQTALTATWDIDYVTGIATYGAGSYPVFGHPLVDIPDFRAFKKIVLPDSLAPIASAIKTAVETGSMVVQEFQVKASDGRILWLESRGQAVLIDGQPTTRLRGLTIDITDRKLRQEETERQRAELESIYQTAPVGLALFDAVTLRYLRINDRQVEIIGLPREKILGELITDVVPVMPGLEELLRIAASGRPVRNQLLHGELPGRPGEQRSFNVSYSPVVGANGSVETIAAVILEVTHQKKAEAALIQSEKLAAVGRLASSISHEINNPLEAITNLLYLIGLSDDLPESTRQYLQTAQGELTRVCQIATQTLRFHRQAVRATRVSAADLVDAVLNLYQGRLANSHIQVDARYATSTTILCFENDIRQVLNNLIANAIDAMRPSGGRLIVRAHDATDNSANTSTGEPRHGIRITIADTGHGMSPTVRARLFEPFYTTKDLNGTGLGLWISSGIVSRHQGKLTYRSSEHPIHHGTIFSLFLPWAEAETPPLL